MNRAVSMTHRNFPGRHRAQAIERQHCLGEVAQPKNRNIAAP